MELYNNSNGVLTQIKENPFKLEKILQNIIEKNLKKLFALTLVKSEYAIQNRRFDTLAFDEKNKSFVIIEYKKESNVALSDQGITYLGLLLDYKDTFLVEVNERLNKSYKRSEIAWDETRIIFVSPAFTYSNPTSSPPM